MRQSVLQPADDNAKFTKPISKGLLPPRPRLENVPDKVLVWRERFKTFRFWILDSSVDKAGESLLKDVKRMQAVSFVDLGLHLKMFGCFTQELISINIIKKKIERICAGNEPKLWHASKLSKVLTAILPKGKRNLEESLRRDRIFGPSTHGETLQFKPFVGNYILVEEMSGKYRPIVAREYTDNDWPQIHWNPSKRSVFAPNSGSLEYSSSSNSSEPLIMQPLQNSAASGVISCSTAPFQVQNRGNSEYLAKLSNRIVAPIQPPVKDKDNTTEPTEKKKSIGLGFYKRAGYCENCGVKYDEYMKHVKSSKHQKWALNESNFATIDSLITKIEKNNAIINQTLQLQRQIKVLESPFENHYIGDCEECRAEFTESKEASKAEAVSDLPEESQTQNGLNESSVVSSAPCIASDSTDIGNQFFARPRQPLTELQYNLESEDVSTTTSCFKKRKLQDDDLARSKKAKGRKKPILVDSSIMIDSNTLPYSQCNMSSSEMKRLKDDAIALLRQIELSDSLSEIECFIESDPLAELQDNQCVRLEQKLSARNKNEKVPGNSNVKLKNAGRKQ